MALVNYNFIGIFTQFQKKKSINDYLPKVGPLF